MEITQKIEIEIPEPPATFQVKGKKSRIYASSLSFGELEEIGDAWKERLIESARQAKDNQGADHGEEGGDASEVTK